MTVPRAGIWDVIQEKLRTPYQPKLQGGVAGAAGMVAPPALSEAAPAPPPDLSAPAIPQKGPLAAYPVVMNQPLTADLGRPITTGPVYHGPVGQAPEFSDVQAGGSSTAPATVPEPPPALLEPSSPSLMTRLFTAPESVRQRASNFADWLLETPSHGFRQNPYESPETARIGGALRGGIRGVIEESAEQLLTPANLALSLLTAGTAAAAGPAAGAAARATSLGRILTRARALKRPAAELDDLTSRLAQARRTLGRTEFWRRMGAGAQAAAGAGFAAQGAGQVTEAIENRDLKSLALGLFQVSSGLAAAHGGGRGLQQTFRQKPMGPGEQAHYGRPAEPRVVQGEVLPEPAAAAPAPPPQLEGPVVPGEVVGPPQLPRGRAPAPPLRPTPPPPVQIPLHGGPLFEERISVRRPAPPPAVVAAPAPSSVTSIRRFALRPAEAEAAARDLRETRRALPAPTPPPPLEPPWPPETAALERQLTNRPAASVPVPVEPPPRMRRAAQQLTEEIGARRRTPRREPKPKAPPARPSVDYSAPSPRNEALRDYTLYSLDQARLSTLSEKAGKRYVQGERGGENAAAFVHSPFAETVMEGQSFSIDRARRVMQRVADGKPLSESDQIVRDALYRAAEAHPEMTEQLDKVSRRRTSRGAAGRAARPNAGGVRVSAPARAGAKPRAGKGAGRAKKPTPPPAL